MVAGDGTGIHQCTGCVERPLGWPRTRGNYRTTPMLNIEGEATNKNDVILLSNVAFSGPMCSNN